MRPRTALVLLAACQCILAYEQSHAPRYNIKEVLHSLLDKPSKPVKRIVTCTRSLGLTKCISAFGLWRAERALESFNKNTSLHFDLTEDAMEFPWTKYTNVTHEDLQTQLVDCTQKLLQYRPLTFDMSGFSAKLTSNNHSLSIDIHKADKAEGRGSMKKLQKEFYKFAPILMAPGLIISAILPFALPSLKMMVTMVGMMNNMALVGAIFTILRNNAFDDKYEHRVIYVNKGYKNEKLNLAASNNEEHYHTNNFGFLYEDPKSSGNHIAEPPFEDNFDNIEDLPSFSVSPQWIKEYTNNKMIEMLQNEPDGSIYYNSKLPIRRSKSST